MPRRTSKTAHRRNLVRWAVIAAVTVVVLLVLYFGVTNHWLSLESLRTHRDELRKLISGHYAVALVLTTLACIALITSSAPVSGILTFACGMLFGRWVGTAVALIAETVGATLAMLLVRYVLKDFVRKRVESHDNAKKLLKLFSHHKGSFLLFMRLMPGFPFWLSNVLIGLTSIAVWRFALLTLLGDIPSTFIYCSVGASLVRANSLSDLVSPGTLIALGLLALLALVPVVLHQLERHGVLPEGWPFSRA